MHEIINATKDQLKFIHSLAHEIWPVTYGSILSEPQMAFMLEQFYSHSSLENQMECLHHSFILIKEADNFAGFASFSPHEENPSTFHLNKIYILPSLQGKNIGKQLLNYIINQIKKEGANSLQLNVNRFNKALHFYEKQGFSIIRQEDIDIGEGYWMNDYVMERKI